MYSSTLFSAALFSLATLTSGHGVIINAQGEKGSPASVGFQVDPNIARNCTGISPCQQDTTIIRDAEITANIVNECGRTELTGNIDVGENTENALAAGAVTKVKAGTVMAVTIHQVNADGAGPYSCDLDQTSNAGILSQNLTVTNNVPGVNGLSQGKTQDFTINVQMPDNLACTGASTGNVCTVRCRNNAVAGPFGGCFAVQQTDVTPTVNNANKINTAQTLEGIDAQIAQNQVDLGTAIAANQQQGTDSQVKAKAAADALAGLSLTSKASPTQTLSLENVGQNAAVATESATKKAGATASAATKASKASKAAGKGAGATAASAATSATETAATAKKGKNNNNKRGGLSLKWARRAMEGSE